VQDKNSLSILYLGKRGGGAKLIPHLSKEIEARKKMALDAIGVRADNECLDQLDQSKVVRIIPTGYSFRTALQILDYWIHPQKLMNALKLVHGGVCLVPMISPAGQILERILVKQGIRIIRIIHDAQRHPGDIWPSSRTTKKILLESAFAIVLSTNVEEKIKRINPNTKTSIYVLPPFHFKKQVPQLSLPSSYILFIGRIRQYKGVDRLVHAFKLMTRDDLNLVIAGEGNLSKLNQANILIINKWLAEAEIAELIDRADVIVFPYQEASQSGIIPYCVQENKKLVITKLEGLLEQTSGYENCEVAGFSPEDLADAIERSLSKQMVEGNHIARILGSNIVDNLLESGYFVR
jgi:glycosyltransferase involved in cell wall biosynthesis